VALGLRKSFMILAPGSSLRRRVAYSLAIVRLLRALRSQQNGIAQILSPHPLFISGRLDLVGGSAYAPDESSSPTPVTSALPSPNRCSNLSRRLICIRIP